VVQCDCDVYMVFVQARTYKYRLYLKNIKVLKLNKITNYAPLTNECSEINQDKNAWRHIASEDILDLNEECICVRPSCKIVCIGYRTQIHVSMGIHFIIVYNVDTHCWNKLL